MQKEVPQTANASREEKRRFRELRKHTKTVRIEYPDAEQDIEEGWHTVHEVFSDVEYKMNKHYGSNEKLKY